MPDNAGYDHQEWKDDFGGAADDVATIAGAWDAAYPVLQGVRASTRHLTLTTAMARDGDDLAKGGLAMVSHWDKTFADINRAVQSGVQVADDKTYHQ